MVPLTAPTPVQAPPFGAAYLIHHDAVESVRALLQASGLRIGPPQGGDGQVPRFTVMYPDARVQRDPAIKDLLTERELQVLRGMARGKSNGDIGREIYLSEETVKTHARRLFRKIGARDRANAVAIGYQRGILGGA